MSEETQLSRRNLLSLAAIVPPLLLNLPEIRKDPDVDTRQLVDIFNQDFAGQLQIGLEYNQEEYVNYLEHFTPVLPSREEFSYFWAYVDALRKKTNYFDKTSSDEATGYTTTAFFGQELIDLGDGVGGTCSCRGNKDYLVVVLVPSIDEIIAHELAHQGHLDGQRNTQKEFDWDDWTARYSLRQGAEKMLYPLLVARFYWQLNDSYGSDETDYIKALQLFRQTYLIKRSDNLEPDSLLDETYFSIRGKYAEPAETTMDIVLASVNVDEMIATIASVVALKGKKALESSLGIALSGRVSHIIDLLANRSENGLYAQAKYTADNFQKIKERDPVAYEIIARLEKDQDVQTVAEEVTDWCLEKTCQIVCVEVFNMNSEQLEEAKKQDYAFMREFSFTQYIPHPQPRWKIVDNAQAIIDKNISTLVEEKNLVGYS